MKIITENQYRKALKIAAEYRLQNDGFFAKLTIGESGDEQTDDKKDVRYYDDLEKLTHDCFMWGINQNIILYSCKKITKEEFDDNYLPY